MTFFRKQINWFSKNSIIMNAESDLSSMRLTCLPFHLIDIKNIVYLDLSNNSLKNICGIEKLASLKELRCSHNQLTTVDVLPLGLVILYLQHNRLTSILYLPKSLQILVCFCNSLQTLPKLPDSLIFLGCHDNQLKCLPDIPAGLETVYAQYNPLIKKPTVGPSTRLYLD